MKPIATLGFAAALLSLAGCSQQTVTSAQHDADKNIAQAQKDINKAAQNVKPTVQKVDLAARVTVALRANQNLPSTIRVDASTTGVRLRGTVGNAHQKSLAGQVATDTLGPGKTVDNEITVS